MNPVVGLDISKEESHGQAFLARGKPFRGAFHFEHTRDGDGLANLHQVLRDMENVLIRSSPIGLESPNFLKLRRMLRTLTYWESCTTRKSLNLLRKEVCNFSICAILQDNTNLFQRCVYSRSCDSKPF